MITLEIPLSLPSLNKWQRWHWAKRRQYQHVWDNTVWALFVEATKGEKRHLPIDHLYLIIESHRWRKCDQDNLMAGCKPLLDALVHGGIIEDDSSRHLRIEEVRQILCPKGEEKTIAIIQPIDNTDYHA